MIFDGNNDGNNDGYPLVNEQFAMEILKSPCLKNGKS
jgi:hypothetical protein